MSYAIPADLSWAIEAPDFVLFGGLRKPNNVDEIPKGDSPAADEEPFHCLLQDDSLITAFSITTDQLLQPPTADHVELVIKVKVRATRRTMYNDTIW